MKCSICEKDDDVVVAGLQVEGELSSYAEEVVGSFKIEIDMKGEHRICRGCVRKNVDNLAEHIKTHKGITDE